MWASGGLESGGERLTPEAGAGICLCPPELPLVYSRCAEKAPGLSAGLGASTEPQGARGSGWRCLLPGMAGLRSRGPCPGFPFMATSAGRIRAATAPASVMQAASSSYGREMLQIHCSPAASPLCARSPPPLAAAHCQLALLVAGAAAGIEGVVPAKTSEPVEAGVRIWASPRPPPFPRVCSASKGEFLLFLHALSSSSSNPWIFGIITQ